MSAWTTVPRFADFLAKAKDDHALNSRGSGAPQNAHFIPRNFLLEERLDASRVASYAAELSAGPASFAEWDEAHKRYLERHVFVRPPAIHDYRRIERANPRVCPETFRAALALLAFQGTDFDTYLIRLVPVADLAWL